MADIAIQTSTKTEKRLKMSYEEFLNFGEETTHAEWVDGEVIVFVPPLIVHQDITTFLASLLRLYAQLLNLGKVLIAPTEMRLKVGKSGREPDILFVARENLHRLEPERLVGPADLVVEVVSEESVERDRVDKFHEYQIAGVREYWLIDPRSGYEQVDGYYLLDSRQYQAILPDEGDRYHSIVLPGFWLKAAWFWQEELPDPLLTLAEIRGLSKEQAEALRAVLLGS